MLRFAPTLFVPCLAACVPSTAPEQCRRIVAVSCEKLFQCTPTQAATLYGDEAACRSVQEKESECATAKATCEVDPGRFERCLSDTLAAPCSTTEPLASCSTAELCRTTTTGSARCSGVSSMVTAGGCTFGLDHCSDGNTYAVRCAASSCTCVLNGRDGEGFTSALDFCADSTASTQAMGEQCGWQLR